MRLHHGHSAALGFVLALSLQRHALTYALLIFVAGICVGRAWLLWKRSATALSRLGASYGIRLLNRMVER